MSNTVKKIIVATACSILLFGKITGPGPAGEWHSLILRETAQKLFLNEQARTAPARPDYCTNDFLLGKINYRKDTVLFAKVEPAYTYNQVYLKKEVYEAFKKMYEAARQDQVRLLIVSGCRTFNDQQCIWDNKWKSASYQAIGNEKERALAILQYVAAPGTSRHHWGTEIDFNSAKLAYYQAGEGKKMYEWMKKNAHRFGFYQPYTPFGDDRPSGYREEMWHWSYRPLSAVFLREYLNRISARDLAGFEGAAVLQEMEVIQHWVDGIHPDCKQVKRR